MQESRMWGFVGHSVATTSPRLGKGDSRHSATAALRGPIRKSRHCLALTPFSSRFRVRVLGRAPE